MGKATSGKLKGATSAKAWKMLLDGKSYKEIGDAIGRTTTAVKVFAANKYRKEADILWSLQIRSVGSCEVCGSRLSPNAHHILEKSVWRHLRHDLSNGICLCASCHTFSRECCPHGNLPAVQAFMDWLRTERPGLWIWYGCHKFDKKNHEVDYEQAYYELKAMPDV
jgi:hypothetical protein